MYETSKYTKQIFIILLYTEKGNGKYIKSGPGGEGFNMNSKGFTYSFFISLDKVLWPLLLLVVFLREYNHYVDAK